MSFQMGNTTYPNTLTLSVSQCTCCSVKLSLVNLTGFQRITPGNHPVVKYPEGVEVRWCLNKR